MFNIASIQSTVGLLATLAVLSLWASFPARAQQTEWKRLTQETESLYRAGRYAQAMTSAKQAVRVAEDTFGQEHPFLAMSLNDLALQHKMQGQYLQAELLYKQALAIYAKVFGSDHPDFATNLTNLAVLYVAQGQYVQAEALFKRSLTINEKVFGPEHPDCATDLNNLAGLYQTQGQYAQAEPLFKRSLAIWEKALGPEHPEVARSLNNLAVLYEIQGQLVEAEPLYKRSLAIWVKALGEEHPNVATSLNNLANLYQTQGQYALAEPLFKRSLTINEKVFGPEHPEIAATLNNLAKMYKRQDQFAQAEILYKRSLVIWEKVLGSEHPNVATSLNNLAAMYGHQGQYAQALPLTRRASAIYRQRIVARGIDDTAVREATQNRTGFLNHLSLLSRNPSKEATENITDEAFQIGQLEQATSTGAAIAKMATRFATGSDAVASLVKRKQDASDLRTKKDAKLVRAVGQRPQERRIADEQQLREEIAYADKEIETIDAELTRRFPEYQELTRADPISVTQVRALLKLGEAMLVYTLDDNSFLWVVKPDGAVFIPIRANAKIVATKVASIRAEMDFDGTGNASRVSIHVLHELYQSIFAPAAPYLVGVKHVMVVSAGPLQSLPLSMLVATPVAEIRSDADYREVDWLIRHYAFSVLPSVNSIQALRQFAKAGSYQEPFAGFGDPLIGGPDSPIRGKRAKMDVATVFRNLVAKSSANTLATMTGAEIADVAAIRSAPRLAETADELRAMGKVLKASPNAIWLQENATETKIKRLDLSKYRTIAFATHGVLAGEIRGVGESGLILTPPQQGSIEDDGYLSTSEIAKLKLNADWVVLSACNTAAADGTPGAEGLSGLAKAFFYAGTRSLLVSHWPIASEATVPLTTGILREYEANIGQGKAEAHRKAMLALIDTPNHTEYAHPVFWAPFVVVGEGGVDRSTLPSSQAISPTAMPHVPNKKANF